MLEKKRIDTYFQHANDKLTQAFATLYRFLHPIEADTIDVEDGWRSSMARLMKDGIVLYPDDMSSEDLESVAKKQEQALDSFIQIENEMNEEPVEGSEEEEKREGYEEDFEEKLEDNREEFDKEVSDSKPAYKTSTYYGVNTMNEPAGTSNQVQVLDLGIFGPQKTYNSTQKKNAI